MAIITEVVYFHPQSEIGYVPTFGANTSIIPITYAPHRAGQDVSGSLNSLAHQRRSAFSYTQIDKILKSLEPGVIHRCRLQFALTGSIDDGNHGTIRIEANFGNDIGIAGAKISPHKKSAQSEIL